MSDTDSLCVEAPATAGTRSVTFSRCATYVGDFPTLRRDLLDAVPRFIEIEQGTRALRLFERMNITALKICRFAVPPALRHR
jgi:hypothetical protein